VWGLRGSSEDVKQVKTDAKDRPLVRHPNAGTKALPATQARGHGTRINAC